MIRAEQLSLFVVDALVPGMTLATLTPWRHGATLADVARRINLANLQPATVVNVDCNPSEVRVTYKVGRTTLSTGWRRGTYLPIYLTMQDDDLTPSATSRDTETPNTNGATK